MAKLSPAQERALHLLGERLTWRRLFDGTIPHGGWWSAYSLDCREVTLEILVGQGLVERAFAEQGSIKVYRAKGD